MSLSNISEITSFSEEIQPVVDEQFINQLITCGLYDVFSKKPSDEVDNNIMGFFSLSSILRVNLIQTNNFENILNDLPNRTEPLNLVQEQQNDEVIRKVISWNNRGNPR